MGIKKRSAFACALLGFQIKSTGVISTSFGLNAAFEKQIIRELSAEAVTKLDEAEIRLAVRKI